MDNTFLIIVLAGCLVLATFLILPSSVFRKSKPKDQNIITTNLPLAMSVKKGKNIEITSASGSILSEFEDLIGKDPSEVLPMQIYTALNAAIEEAFNGRVTNKMAVINGASYSLSVKPIVNTNSRTVSEVISVAVEADKPKVNTEIKPNGTIMVIYLQIEGISTVEEALGNDSTNKLLNHMKTIINEKVRTNDTVVDMENGSYIIFLQHIRHKEFANNLLDSILQEMCAPVIIDGYEITMPVNHRIVIFSEND